MLNELVGLGPIMIDEFIGWFLDEEREFVLAEDARVLAGISTRSIHTLVRQRIEDLAAARQQTASDRPADGC